MNKSILEKARTYEKEFTNSIKTEERPTFHLSAPIGWINDPNGFIYYNGEYHLFYQYFPYDCKWGTMHWGHATSKDLIMWKHYPIALYPTKEYDQNGCFSGTAIIKDEEI